MTDVRERPILFSGEMVRAVLGGAKTKTRRVIKPETLTLIPRRTMGSDLPPSVCGENYGRVVAGKKTKAKMNRCGAVCGLTDTGKWLGLKPGEFDFCCPYAEGRTALRDGRWNIVSDEPRRLWVREGWNASASFQETEYIHCNYYVTLTGRCIPETTGEITAARLNNPSDVDVYYKADHVEATERDASEGIGKMWWRPSIHMPRWASRITLEVTGVRVERLKDITEDDIKAEGVSWDKHIVAGSWLSAWIHLWNSINATRGYSWASNPWVWVLEFRRVDRGENAGLPKDYAAKLEESGDDGEE